ncbi:caveolin-3-like isoform X2 [Anneissia japonica]|uniref:caveolin-3-like isoform X2 n=1 Tax=Anneissia japonica TaxID=1529436 RepID=UPI001425A233|nr:caveolin-3-like isoform X2 [Anneissia japonica]
MDDTSTHEEPVYEQFKDKNAFIQYLTPRIMSNGEKAEADIGRRLSQHELTIPYTSDMAAKNKAEVDIMLERDPNHVNEDVRVGFEEVFAEPNGMHSFDMVWEYSFLTFSSSKLWCYKIITAFCSLPFSLCWGIQFACLTFCHIWYVMPCLKMWNIILDWVGKIWSNCIRTFADPLYESAGRVLGNIRITTRTE